MQLCHMFPIIRMYLGDLFGSGKESRLRVHCVPYRYQVSIAQPTATGKLVQCNPRMGQEG